MLILALVTFYAYIWQLKPLEPYSSIMIGILTIIYLVLNIKTKNSLEHSMLTKINSMILTCAVLIIVFATGGINSLLFFILYFLLFYIAFDFSSEAVFVFTILLCICLLPQMKLTDVASNFSKILSLLLLTPLAYFFGKEKQTQDAVSTINKDMQLAALETTNQIREDAVKILKNNQKTLSKDALISLNDIVDKSNVLNEELDQ